MVDLPRQTPARSIAHPAVAELGRQHTALTHQCSGSDGVTSSCPDPSHPQDTAPALQHRQPTSAGDLLDRGYSRAMSARRDACSQRFSGGGGGTLTTWEPGRGPWPQVI